MGVVLLVISGLLLVAALPSWPLSKGWGYSRPLLPPFS
jgi:Protein of unknown function (DUF3309)